MEVEVTAQLDFTEPAIETQFSSVRIGSSDSHKNKGFGVVQCARFMLLHSSLGNRVRHWLKKKKKRKESSKATEW